MQMCDWMARAIGLPDFYVFNNSEDGKGVGKLS